MKYRFKPASREVWQDYHTETVDLIMKAFAAVGDEISKEDAFLAWSEYSENMCAGWLMHEMYSFDDVRKAVDPYIEPVDNE